jgi:hypothetical protein
MPDGGWVDALFTDGETLYILGKGLSTWRAGDAGVRTFEDEIDLPGPEDGEDGFGWRIAFDGATPVLVEGTVEDLTAAFAVYGQTCTHDGHGRGVGSVTFPAAKASAFIAEPGEGGVLVPARESLTREYVALLNEKVEGLDFDYPQPGYSNVMPTGWSKATGVALLAERMGIGLDQVVVFGDAGNDLPMFEAVPNSVAVANATDEAAAAARWHIGRCEDDAVALAIEALVAGEWPFES